MQNVFDEVAREVEAARMAMIAVDQQSAKMAKLLSGRLRNIPLDYWTVGTLRDLKRELRAFDMTTGRWKEP